MKKLLALLSVLLFVSCSGLQISDDSSYQVIAYAAGKSMAIGINKIKPEVDPELTSAWVDFMDRNAGMLTIGSTEMLAFFNECVRIIASDDFDQYGLIDDLSILLTIYGAEISQQTHQMVKIDPVPIEILKMFELGYSNGRRITRKELGK